MSDDLDEDKTLVDEDFDPTKAKTTPLLDDALSDDDTTNLDDFESDVPEDEEEGSFNLYNSGEEDLNQYSY